MVVSNILKHSFCLKFDKKIHYITNYQSVVIIYLSEQKRLGDTDLRSVTFIGQPHKEEDSRKDDVTVEKGCFALETEEIFLFLLE